LINVSRLVGATLGVAVLGSIFAGLSHGGQTQALFLVGMRFALLLGALAELLGSCIAFGVIERHFWVSRSRQRWTLAKELHDYV
jgi:hypothetical protein